MTAQADILTGERPAVGLPVVKYLNEGLRVR